MPGNRSRFRVVDLTESSHKFLVPMQTVVETLPFAGLSRWLVVDRNQNAGKERMLTLGGGVQNTDFRGIADNVQACFPFSADASRDPSGRRRYGHLPFFGEEQYVFSLNSVGWPLVGIGIYAKTLDPFADGYWIQQGEIEPVVESSGKGRRSSGPMHGELIACQRRGEYELFSAPQIRA